MTFSEVLRLAAVFGQLLVVIGVLVAFLFLRSWLRVYTEQLGLQQTQIDLCVAQVAGLRADLDRLQAER